jgi:hypothetical protein
LLRRNFQNFEILEWNESSPGNAIMEFRDNYSAIAFLRPFLRDPLNISNIRKLVDVITAFDISRLSDHQVLELLAWQLASGRLKISELSLIEIGPSTAEGLAETPAQEVRRSKKEEKSWIEIELVDEENQPVPGERYRITLSDGKTLAEGTTDANGQARVNDIDRGTCKITFPDLDKDAWKEA